MKYRNQKTKDQLNRRINKKRTNETRISKSKNASMIFLDGAMVYPALQLSIPLCCSRFIQEPGEIVFVPARWWHAVLNLEDFRWEMGEVGWKAFYI